MTTIILQSTGILYIVSQLGFVWYYGSFGVMGFGEEYGKQKCAINTNYHCW
jgi:hypothetical protein